jgi:cupin 2 domain-containing protein
METVRGLRGRMRVGYGNIFAKMPRGKGREVVQELVGNKKLRLERIISTGQVTPVGVWLQDRRDEWVVVLKGKAVLRFEGRKGLMRLEAGDYLLIPRNTRHRVEWTRPGRETVWVAVYF